MTIKGNFNWNFSGLIILLSTKQNGGENPNNGDKNKEFLPRDCARSPVGYRDSNSADALTFPALANFATQHSFCRREGAHATWATAQCDPVTIPPEENNI